MKITKLITLTVIAFWLNMPSHAQFNTIGTISNKRVNTANPSKSHDALTDSIVVADSISESKITDIGGDGQTIDSPMNNQDLMSLVSLPLKNIHISSGFGMRVHPIYHKRILHNGKTFLHDMRMSIQCFLALLSRLGKTTGLVSLLQ